MILVVDTNVIIAGALRKSITQELLFNNMFQLYAPEFVKEEIEKYKLEIMKKGNYSETEFHTILSLIFSQITVVPEDEYKTYKKEVLEFIPDIKDWPFLALAKHLDASVWTYDSVLKKQQNIVKILTTSDLIQWLKK